MPFFSVIIPLFNKESHISNTLNSVYLQTFEDFEVIIIDDQSTDESVKKVNQLKNNKTFIFQNEEKGVSQARNLGMKKAKGDYFAFLDADDEWMPNHLQDLYQLIKDHPNCGLYCTNYTFDYGNEFTVKTVFPTLPKNKYWKGIVDNYFLASLNNRIAWTSAVVIPKEAYINIGGFDIKFSSGQDTDYWTRIALNYPVSFTKEATVLYNLKAENRISNIAPSSRSFMTFEKFIIEEKTNTSLKKFNDMYRAELAIKHKIIGDLKTFKYYSKDIKYNNLNFTKIILLKLPEGILSNLWKLKQWLKTKKFDFYI
jgi:glycosyltransferase involved in cell wall biosynthesis